jgi:hypothetical protein
VGRMKLSEAARTWAESKRELERLRPRLEAAAEVLKEHFRGSDDREYRSRHGRIGYAVTARLQLDTEKVRAELGDRLSDFQRRVTVEILSLLE